MNKFNFRQFNLKILFIKRLKKSLFLTLIILLFSLSSGGKAETNNSSYILKLEDILSGIDYYHPSLKTAELKRQEAKAQLMSSQSNFIPRLGNRFTPETYINEKSKRKNAFSDYGEVTWQSPYAFELFGGVRYTSRDLLPSDTFTYPGNKGYLTTVKSSKLGDYTGSEALLGLRLPLFRNLLIDEFRGDLQKAKIELSVAELDVLQKRAELFLKASEKYWDWVSAGLKYSIAESLLDIAFLRAGGIAERVKEGANPPIDLIEAESQIASREENIAKVRRDFEKESINLSLYLWKSENSFERPARNNLPEKIDEPSLIDKDLQEKHLSLSLARRPEMLRLNLEKQQEKINLKLAKNNLLPKIDLEIMPGQNLNDIDEGPNLMGSINLDIPLYPLKARSEILKAQTKLQKLNLNSSERNGQIKTEIENALSYMETSYQRVIKAQETLEKLKALESGEQTRFQYGNSNLFFLNARESAATDSENKLIDALADHQKAVANYNYAIGKWSVPDF